jgi:hypothetical protein
MGSNLVFDFPGVGTLAMTAIAQVSARDFCMEHCMRRGSHILQASAGIKSKARNAVHCFCLCTNMEATLPYGTKGPAQREIYFRSRGNLYANCGE